MTIVMKMLPAGTFKAQCLALMDEVEATREPIVITKRGKPVARLVPVELEEEDEIFGFMAGKGTITILGDIVEPVIPIEEWESLNDPA
jgi:prevent-host-death family protein